MKGYFDTIPVDIDESARIDGAGHARIFFGLIMRLALPILVVVFFVSFQSTFNELPIASGDPARLAEHHAGRRSRQPGVQPADPGVGADGRRRRDGGDPAASSLFLFTQQSLVTGLTAGAVKG